MSNTTAYSKIESDQKFYLEVDGKLLEESVSNIEISGGGYVRQNLAQAQIDLSIPNDSKVTLLDEKQVWWKKPTGEWAFASENLSKSGIEYYSRSFLKKFDVIINNTDFNGLLNVELYFNKGDELQIENWGFNRLTGGIYRSYFSLKTTAGVQLDYTFTPNSTAKTFDSSTILTGIRDFYIYKRQSTEIIGKITVDLSNVRSGTTNISLPNGQGVFSDFAYKGANYLVNKTIFQDSDNLSKSSEGLAYKGMVLATSPSKDVYLHRYGVNVPASGKYRQSFQFYDNDSNIAVNNMPSYFMNESGAIVVETDNPISGINQFNLFKNGENIGFVIVDVDSLTPGSYRSISSVAQGKNGNIKYDKYTVSTSGGGSFDENKFRLIVGNDLWLTDLPNLQLFKDNLTFTRNYDSLLAIQNSSDDNPISEYFGKSLKIDPANYSNNTIARIFNKVVGVDLLYNKKVKINKVTRASIVGKEAQVINCGNSMMDGVTPAQSVPQYVRENLISWGANTTFHGTRSAGGTNHEGRSSWEYAILIGLRTTYNGAVYMPTNANIGTLTLNPFIKVATPAQIAANPAWCFENTPSTNGGASGKLRELNYTESQAAGGYTGDYYTFDFAKYVNTNLGGLNPAKKLIVTNALGFNDLNHNGKSKQSKLDCLLGMDIFYNRVKQYRADAIVGFIPIIAVHDTNSWSDFANFIERAIIKAKQLGADVIPVWQHVDHIGSFAYDGSEIEFSATNDSLKSTGGDKVHPVKFGSRQCANPVSNYIANKL